jgi:hypothetical protein
VAAHRTLVLKGELTANEDSRIQARVEGTPEPAASLVNELLT